MERDPKDPAKDMPPQEEGPVCELVVRNGRHAGSRLPLTGPLTLVGKAAGCDIRLQMEGVEGRHCMLAHTAAGLVVRDLQTQKGTLVNGDRVQIVALQDGDILTVGPLEFCVQGLAEAARVEEKEPTPEEEALRDAWRVQTAAVAAQQAALEEQEKRLEQGRLAFQQQQEQLAAHLEEKRRKLLSVSAEVKAERETLNQDRAAYEEQVGKIKGDLTEAQRELMEGQRKVEKERERLSDFHQRLKQRWHRFWLAERKKLRASQAELAEQARLLGERIQDLKANEERVERKRLRFNSLYEYGRGQLREAWSKVRTEQHQWKHRRGKERAVLRVRERDLEQAEHQLVQAQQLFLLDKKAWDAKKQALVSELNGLDRRIDNQRLRISDLRQLEEKMLAEQAAATPIAAEQPAAPPIDATIPNQPNPHTDPAAPLGETIISISGGGIPILPGLNQTASTRAGLETRPHGGGGIPILPVATQPKPIHSRKEQISRRDWNPATGEPVEERLKDLHHLAGSLSDQRLELVEQWHRLTMLYRGWQREKEHAALELEELAKKLLNQGQALAQKEQDQHTVETNLKGQHEDLVQLRHQMIAWRARLRTREHAWEGERTKLLAETRHRESLAEQQHSALVDLRQHWMKRHQEEMERLQADRSELENRRHEVHLTRQELTQRTATLEDEKRHLAEKALALEQFRQEVAQKAEQPNAERKLERFRRRWLTQNTLALHHLATERETLQKEMANLDARAAELAKRAETLGGAEADLVQKQAAWEHQQSLAQTRQQRLQEELRHAEQQRVLSEQQYQKMRDEVERIARSLFAEPEPPAWSEMAA